MAVQQQPIDRNARRVQRRGFQKLLIASALAVALSSCVQNSRIIRQTPNTAIVAGEGDSRIEAEFAAMERARDLLQEFHQTREMECSQEYRGQGGNIIYPGAGHLVTESRAYTFWQCVVFAGAGPAPENTKAVRESPGGEASPKPGPTENR